MLMSYYYIGLLKVSLKLFCHEIGPMCLIPTKKRKIHHYLYVGLLTNDSYEQVQITDMIYDMI